MLSYQKKKENKNTSKPWIKTSNGSKRSSYKIKQNENVPRQARNQTFFRAGEAS